jgi:endoglucanase
MYMSRRRLALMAALGVLLVAAVVLVAVRVQTRTVSSGAPLVLSPAQPGPRAAGVETPLCPKQEALAENGETITYRLAAMADPCGEIDLKSPGPTAPPARTPAPPGGGGSTTPPARTGTPVRINGKLAVCGTRLCNQQGQQIQLRGMSTHGIQWFSQCANAASLDALAKDWKADVIRISMYIQEDGYETNPRRFTDMVHNYIEMASQRGMYAIVDWHQLSPGDPNHNLSRAKTFFTEVARRHAAKPNVIYEVANEPNGVTWSRIKSYHEQIIPVIRAQDPDSVILLGTRAWSSLGISDGADETEVINNPVKATNIMYTFHFYAASHDDEYLGALSRATDRIPMFVTEFGTQTSSGDGGNDFGMAQKYIDLMAKKKISWTNWNFSDDHRSGAVFTGGTCPSGSFAGTDQLKPAGVWIRERILAGR